MSSYPEPQQQACNLHGNHVSTRNSDKFQINKKWKKGKTHAQQGTMKKRNSENKRIIRTKIKWQT